MEMKEISAKTVEEAVELALRELDARREEVEIEVISRGKTGFLGIRAENARVRVKRIAAEDSAAVTTMDVIKKMLASAGVSAVAMLRDAHDSETGGPVVDIEGEDSGLLIGHRGETLAAMQFLVNLLVNRGRTDTVRVTLDVEQYVERRHRSIRELALGVAERVAASGRAIVLEPMPPRERRVVHLTLADHPRVTTQSVGMGADRRVSISLGRRVEEPERNDSNAPSQ